MEAVYLGPDSTFLKNKRTYQLVRVDDPEDPNTDQSYRIVGVPGQHWYADADEFKASWKIVKKK